MKTRYLFLLSSIIVALSSCGTSGKAVSSGKSQTEENRFSYTLQRIWDDGNYNAFTSIERYKGSYLVAFRQAHGHVFDEDGIARGKIRIIASKDGKSWTTAAVLKKEGYDLRDPKLSIMPDGRLMVIMGGSVYKGDELVSSMPHVSFSSNGRDFSEPQPVVVDRLAASDFDWLWRVTWHEGTGYAVNYTKASEHVIKLMSTHDGIHFGLVREFDVPDFPNECTVRFLADGRMAIMARRDSGNRHAWWGVSSAPYQQWEWKEMEFHVGGPDFIVLDDGSLIAGGRSHLVPSSPRTTLYTGTPDGVFRESIVLPSGGDNSYPGFLRVGDEIWVSYYSGHATKYPAIYLAKITLDSFRTE